MRQDMLKRSLSAAGLLCLLAWIGLAQPDDAKATAENSMKAMGSANLRTLVISGDGYDGCVGQGFSVNGHWRKFSNKNYVRSIDFEQQGWRMQRIRGDGEDPPQHGGCSDRPVPDAPQNQVTMVTPNSNWTQQLDWIMLPQGFLKTAVARNAMVKQETVKGKKYTVLTFPGENKATVSGYINGQGYVERITTRIDNNVLGDMQYETTYTDWKDFGGVKFPTHILQVQGDWPVFELTVHDVKANVPVDLGQQAKGKGPGAAKGKSSPGGGPPAGVPVEDLGGGFWMVGGGYASILADFKDYLVMIEAGSNDARTEQVLAEAKRMFPNKPLRYVINTHAHFDHAGGLRAAVAEGATIVTHQKNKGYYEKIFKYPHTLVPDKLSQMNPQPKIKVEYAGQKKMITDGTHTIELYHMDNSIHDEGEMFVYLPVQKVVLEADEFNTLAAGAPAPEEPNPNHVNMLANIEQRRLIVDRIIPVHLPNDNRKVTLAELKTVAGRK